MDREKRTVSAMIQLYCRGVHGSQRQLCADCAKLEQYALGRLERCSFGSGKPVCANCSVHCYSKAMRQRIQEVMRYAGPRMILRHPVLAVGHVLDKRKVAPAPKSDDDKRST